MGRGKHTEAQIIEALKQVEAGRKVEEVSRQYGVSKHTMYGWKAKYGGLEVSEAQEVKQLRDENSRLKRLVAELSLDKDALQSVIRKNSLTLVVKRAEVQRLRADFAFSERHAFELMSIPRSSCRYRSRRDDSVLRQRLIELAQEKPRFGYRRLHVLLRRAGEQINPKRVQRVYREAGLCVRRIRRKRLTRSYTPRPTLSAPNQEWAIDLASDVTASGRRLRVFSVVDAFTRECLALETDTSMPSQRVTRILQSIVDRRGRPEFLKSDNGPELSSRHYLAWCVERSIGTIHIQPGKPTQNGHVESFPGRLRDECLNASWFWNLWDARCKIASWRNEYNQQRPHSALAYRMPDDFARQWAHAASPSAFPNTTPPEADQGQALRAPAAALTQPRLRGQTFHQEGDAHTYAARFRIT